MTPSEPDGAVRRPDEFRVSEPYEMLDVDGVQIAHRVIGAGVRQVAALPPSTHDRRGGEHWADPLRRPGNDRADNTTNPFNNPTTKDEAL